LGIRGHAPTPHRPMAVWTAWAAITRQSHARARAIALVSDLYKYCTNRIACCVARSDTHMLSAAINGQWSEWTAVSSCSVSCGQGVIGYSRSCTNSTPANGGLDCEGNSTKQETCNVACGVQLCDGVGARVSCVSFTMSGCQCRHVAPPCAIDPPSFPPPPRHVQR
jgi:hypothetical protein